MKNDDNEDTDQKNIQQWKNRDISYNFIYWSTIL